MLNLAVRMALAKKGWTVASLAREIGISPTNLSDLFSGRRNSNLRLAEIAKMLEIRVKDLQ